MYSTGKEKENHRPLAGSNKQHTHCGQILFFNGKFSNFDTLSTDILYGGLSNFNNLRKEKDKNQDWFMVCLPALALPLLPRWWCKGWWELRLPPDVSSFAALQGYKLIHLSSFLKEDAQGNIKY